VKQLNKAGFISFFVIAFCCHSIHAQVVTEDWLKSEYTILLAGYITWPDEEKIDTFDIGVFASPAIFTQISLKSQTQTLKDKPIRVSYFKRSRDIAPVDVLYVDEKKNKSLKKIFNRFEGEPILIVSDSAKVNSYSMLNLLGMNIAGEKPFQINKINIDQAGLMISPKILLIGGDEDDLRDIYRELEDEGNRMRAELDTVIDELDQKKVELESSERKLVLRSEEVQQLVREIEFQTEELTTLSDSVDLKQLDLIEKVQLLAAQEGRIKERESEIELLNRNIAEKEKAIEDRGRVIQKQLDDLVIQTAMMNEQEKILRNQRIQIERQAMVILLFIILSVLILGMGFVSYRAYRIKKRANRILKEKNQVIQEQKSDIENQKEEIMAQRDELQEFNIKIEKQKEKITDSIYYALTIQQAMLPSIEELKKLFESFIIYLPKDIVSGDFYWFASKGLKRTGERNYYFAVVDCTGHGVPGGFLSMIGARALESIVNEHKVDQTDEILELMDKRIRKALNQRKSENEDGMDVCLCKITKQGKDSADPSIYLSFSGAKRSLFLMRKGQKIDVIKGDRRGIGGRYFNPHPFSKIELALKSGDRIYLTSDGLMDQHSPEREKFSTRRFIECLNRSGSLSMSEQQTMLEEELFGFMKHENQRDDITIMGINL
jgi:serine phosphatase RsbU (regulator of sigma subunit)